MMMPANFSRPVHFRFHFAWSQWSGFDIRYRTRREFLSECRILSSTGILYLLAVPLILTFAKAPAEKGSECQNRTTRRFGRNT